MPSYLKYQRGSFYVGGAFFVVVAKKDIIGFFSPFLG